MIKRVPIEGLTEGAILASLVALLAYAARYVPPITLLAPLVCPLPLTVLVIRHGTRIAVLAAVVAAAIGVTLAGPLTGLLIASFFAPLGISMGVAVRRRLDAPRIVLISALTWIAVTLVNMGLSIAISGVNPVTVLLELMQKSQEMTEAFYTRIGAPPQIQQAVAQMKELLAVAPRLLAGLFVLGGLIFAWYNYAFGRLVLRKVGIELPALPPMTTWRLPPFFLWVFIAGFALPIVTARLPGMSTAGETIGVNLLIVAKALFQGQGCIVGWVLMEKYGMARWFRWILITLALTNPLYEIVAFYLGIADAAFGLRQRWTPVSSS